MWMGDWSPMGGLAMGIAMIAFWALVIWGVAWLVRQTTSHGTTGPKDVLDKRYAAGEIDEDEYRHRLSVLAGQGER